MNKMSSAPSARLCAARAVWHVFRDGALLENALARQPDYNQLEARDRAFSRLIAATVFRRLAQIDAALKPFVKRTPAGLPHAVLRTGAAQILFLGTPAHAAVGESVEILRRSSGTKAYAGMVNAVLRRVSEKGKALAGTVAPAHNIPGPIRTRWETAYGRQAVRKIGLQLIKEPPLDLYVPENPAQWAETLGGDHIGGHTVRMAEAGAVRSFPGYDDGAWWVQDIAATVPVALLGDIAGLSVLDMCAAPGGKTLQAASLGATVTAVDKSEVRMERVHENLARTGLSADVRIGDAGDAAVTGGDYDVVLLDAPCSATGTFRRHPDVLQNKTPKDITSLIRIQKRLLKAAVAALKPGGRLIYCTCSLQPEEGEAVFEQALKTFPQLSAQAAKLPDFPFEAESVGEKGYVRVLPHFLGEKGGADGFFAGILQINP